MAITNIFIVFTSAHIFHAQNIIKSEGLEKIHFVFTKKAFANEYLETQNEALISHIYPLNVIQLLRLKRSLIRSPDMYRLIVPHFLNVTAQAIYHLLIQNNKLFETAIMPDGNLLFNGFVMKRTDPSNWLRKIKSALLFSKFTLLDHDICSIDDRTSLVYSYMSNTRYTDNSRYEVKLIKMPQQRASGNSGLLILGHYNQHSIDVEDLYRSIESLVSRFELITYKPHPRLSPKKDLFLDILKRECPLLILNTSSKSAESLVGRTLDINTVFAVGSSSLINLKLMQPTLDIYCCAMKEYFKDHYDDRLRQNILDLNIHILPFLRRRDA